MFTKFILVVLFHSSLAVYELNDADYALMPPVFQMDDYEDCLEDPKGLYCTADFALVSDEPSPLLNMMQKYSEHYTTHYNHTFLHRAICITKTCKKFYDLTKGDLGSALEACANETFYNKYKLRARVSDDFACSHRKKNQPIDYVDIAVAVFCITILVANIVASICDCFVEKGKDFKGSRFLYCFSIFRNWDKLVAPAADGREPRLRVLRGLHGIRVLNMILVIAGHSILIHIFLLENPIFIENMFNADVMHILLNGTVIMQTFLVISSFLLVYNWLLHSEKQEPSWKMLPKQFMMRWLRLTPSYAVILALTTTWFGRLASGPYWKKIVGNELSDCRRDWWKHLLYINNYFDNSECLVQTWYLAADLQLYFVAATVFVICRTARTRKIVLSLLFVVGLVVPTLETYYRNVEGVLLVDPELALNLFKNSRVFDEIYKRGHTNLIGYIIGMALGYWLYEWQKKGGDPQSFRKYRFFYWMLFPVGCVCCYSGNIFYKYSPAQSLTVNLLFATFMKPVYAFIICAIILGLVIQFEGIYRTILEWPAWTIPSRLSFCAYLLHIAFARLYIASLTTTYQATVTVCVTRGVVLVCSAYIAAIFFWILVEAPIGNVVQECFTKREPVAGSNGVDKRANKKEVTKKFESPKKEKKC